MVDSVRYPRDFETTPNLNIGLRGRTYPFTCRRALPPPDIPPDSLPLTRDLQSRILTVLSFPGCHLDTFGGSSDIIRAFCSDMVLLETMATQWRRFLQYLRKTNISVEFPKKIPNRQRQQALNEALRAMGHESGIMVDDGGVLNGGLVEQPPHDVFQILQATLQETVSRFTEVMQADLDQLSDLRVVGLLEWFGQSTCRFHYYEHHLTSMVDSQTTDRQSIPMTHKGKTRLGVEVIEELVGRHVHSVMRRTELLIEARSSTPNDPQLVLPRSVRDCITHCPAWLRPELLVVEGEKIREEWVELVRIEHQWQERWCRQRIQPHFDPALTLFGQYVLMGWDESMHKAEIHSRIQVSSHQLQQSQAAAESTRPDRYLTQMLAWIVATLFGMLMLLATGEDNGHICAILLPLSCMPTTYRYLTEGRSIIDIDDLQPPPFMASLSTMFCVLGTGFLLATLMFGKPKMLVTFLIGMSGTIFFELMRRKSKGGVA